jgi:hypothetical protein
MVPDMAEAMKNAAAMQSRLAPPRDRAVNRRPEVQYRHSWTTRQGGGLDSTCMKCSTIIATNMDELSLLVVERTHLCRCCPMEDAT